MADRFTSNQKQTAAASAAKFLEIISHQSVWDIFLHDVVSRPGALVPNLYHDVQKNTRVFADICQGEQDE